MAQGYTSFGLSEALKNGNIYRNPALDWKIGKSGLMEPSFHLAVISWSYVEAQTLGKNLSREPDSSLTWQLAHLALAHLLGPSGLCCLYDRWPG